jgi:Outer membrane protein beta-barrel domain
MKKLLAVVITVIVVSIPMLCQDYPKAEVFGGYQYTRIEPGRGIGGENFNGWNAAVTGNVNPWLGVTGDFSGAYKSISGVSLKQHTFMFGPTVASHSSDKFTPFVHALFGAARSSASVSGAGVSDTSFAMALGGGVDVGVRSFALRLGQFDYLMTRFGGATQNNFRYSAGIVFKF